MDKKDNKCHYCNHEFDKPLNISYGVELWESVECCPKCLSDNFEKNQ